MQNIPNKSAAATGYNNNVCNVAVTLIENSLDLILVIIRSGSYSNIFL